MVLEIPVPRSSVIAAPSSGDYADVMPEIALLRLGFVNVVMAGPRNGGDRGWVLVDAGVSGSRGKIEEAASDRFGAGARPACIVLTHGHFDHVGCLEDLAEKWDVPVYAHPAEQQFLNGQSSYPPADPMAGGGMMSFLSPLFPRSPINVASRLNALPADGSVRFLGGWRWIATPGHSDGHVSLWNAERKILLAGDALITTRQESAYQAIVQDPEMHGPPRYFTPDWQAAEQSVRTLAALEPEIIVTGHGPALGGRAARSALHELAARFKAVAVPAHKTDGK